MNLGSLKEKINGICNTVTAFVTNNTISQFSIFLLVLLLLSWGMIIWYFPEQGVVSGGGTDLQFHTNRFYAVFQAIDYGSFPFYINTDALNHYGYAANLFYPDLMLIPFALLIPVLGFASAYKLMIFVYTILCGIFSYWALSKITRNNLIAFLFALFYTFAIYRIIDISYRGALGEFISFTFLPLVFWGMYEILYGNFKQRWYIVSMGFICLIYTHLLSAFLIFLAVCIALMICYRQIVSNPRRLLYLALAGVVSAVISFAFLLPMFEQLIDNQFYFKTQPLAQQIGTQSVELRRVLWGVFSGLTDNMLRIETIGIVLIIPLLFRLVIKGKHPFLRFADICTFISFILIFALSDLFPWYIFPFNQLTILQFPFRLLQPASFLLACSAAIYLSIICKQTNRSFIIVTCFVLIIGYSIRVTGAVYQGYTKYTVNNKEGHNLDQMEIVGAEYLSSRIPSDPTDDIRYRIQYIVDRGSVVLVEHSDTQIKSQTRDNDKLIIETVQTNTDNLVLPLLYYKGYKAIQGNKELEASHSKDGLLEVKSPQSGKITIWFWGTSLQRISLAISLLALALFVVYIIYTERRVGKSI